MREHEWNIHSDNTPQLLPSCPALLLVLELYTDNRDLYNLLHVLVTSTLELHNVRDKFVSRRQTCDRERPKIRLVWVELLAIFVCVLYMLLGE